MINNFNQELVVHAFQQGRIKSFKKLLKLYNKKDQKLLPPSQLIHDIDARDLKNYHGKKVHLPRVDHGDEDLTKVVKILMKKCKANGMDDPLWIFMNSIKLIGSSEYISPMQVFMRMQKTQRALRIASEEILGK